MSKPHINDTELFKSLLPQFGAYIAITEISRAYRLFKSLGIDNIFIDALSFKVNISTNEISYNGK